MAKKYQALLIILVILGGALRFWRLPVIPIAMNWDEVSHAYNAYSLLSTGRDQWGEALPILNFRAYGDYPTTLNLYLTVPAIALFGPTDFAARFPHALLGTLSIVVMFLAGYWWKRRIIVGLVAALFMAVEPWSLFPSRAIFQSNAVVFLLALGAAAYFRRKYFLTSLAMGLSLFAYHNARIFVPVFALGMFVVQMRSVVRVKWLVLALVGIAIILFPQVRSRGAWVGILDRGAIAHIEQQRLVSQYPPMVTRLLYNRPVYFVTKVVSNYVGYFSPKFLFSDGGTQYQFSVPNRGVLHPINAPFFYVGLLLSVVTSPFLAVWFLVSPLAASITQDKFAVIRATTMIPAVILATAAGFDWLTRRLRVSRGVVFGVYLLVLAGFLASYLTHYFGSYQSEYAPSWQYGHRQMVEFVRQRYDKYDEVIITKRYGEPHEFVLWYWPWDPSKFQAETVLWDYHDNWYWVNGFDKFSFIDDWRMNDVAKHQEGKTILVVSSPDHPVSGAVIDTIYFPDGTPAFILVEI